MKILAYVSADAVAYTDAALKYELVGRGNPPACPIYSQTHIGTGLVPCTPQVIEVEDAAEIYRKDEAGKWQPVHDWPKFYAEQVEAVEKLKVLNVDELEEKIRTAKAQKAK